MRVLTPALLKTIALSIAVIVMGGLNQSLASASEVTLNGNASLVEVAYGHSQVGGKPVGSFANLRKAQDIVISNNDGDVNFDFDNSPAFLGPPDPNGRVFFELTLRDLALSELALRDPGLNGLALRDPGLDDPGLNTTRRTRGPKPTANPEPASMLLLGTGLLVVAAGIRHRRRKTNF